MNNSLNYHIVRYCDFDQVLKDCQVCEIDYIRARLDREISDPDNYDEEDDSFDIATLMMTITLEIAEMKTSDTYYFDVCYKVDQLIPILRTKFSRNIIEKVLNYSVVVPSNYSVAKCK